MKQHQTEEPTPTVESTIAFIQKVHAGQFDKGGIAYWQHPVSVMKRLGEALDDFKFAALLHDVIEDTPTTADDLRAMGYSNDVVAAVVRLTKTGDAPYLEVIQGIARSGDVIAIAVKIADNEDNLDPDRLARLPEEMRGGNEKYRRSIAILKAAAIVERIGQA